MHNRSEKREKKESKSAERKSSIKKDQINLLLYKNSQLQSKGKELMGKTLDFERGKIKSSIGSYPEDRK